MLGGRYINNFIAFTNVFVSSFYFISVAASRRLAAHLDHNFLPCSAMRLNVIPINCISNKMGSFMAGSVVNKIITMFVKKSVVESELVVSWNNVTSATAFELETYDWKSQGDAIDILGLRVDFLDSFDRFALQFSHAFRLAPCTVSTREKIKKVRQAKK